MVYSRAERRYVPEFPETDEAENRFVVLVPPHKIDGKTLPTSPKGFYTKALAAGWEVNAWCTVGKVLPSLYLHDSAAPAEGEVDPNPHKKGDVKFEGYDSNLYVVEARVAFNVPLGFRAHFVSRDYGTGNDGKPDTRSKPGSFEGALVADPVGLPRASGHHYDPVKITRAKDERGRTVETEASFADRKRIAQAQADYLTEASFDGTFIFDRCPYLTSSTELTAWLKEWATYGRLANA